MAYVCKGICTLYKSKTVLQKEKYQNGIRRCTLCESFLEVTSDRCPCCHALLRTRSRRKRN